MQANLIVYHIKNYCNICDKRHLYDFATVMNAVFAIETYISTLLIATEPRKWPFQRPSKQKITTSLLTSSLVSS